MLMLRRGKMLVVCAGLLASMAGCGSIKETLPARAAMEQLLISTAADRAIEQLPTEPLQGKTVFIDISNLEAYDRPYVIERTRKAVLDAGARLAAGPEEAELILEVASGGLSINRRDYLFGIPQIDIPVPFGGGILSTPELPLFKAVFYRSKAKLLFVALDPKTGGKASDMPVTYGKSLKTLWWFLFFGPNEWNDLPEELE